MTGVTDIHYISAPSMLEAMEACVERHAIGHPMMSSGSLKNVDLETWIRLMVTAARSSGRLRLFLSDGRELHAHSIDESMLRSVFPGVCNEKLQETLIGLKESTALRLKLKHNLFSRSWA